VRTLAAKLPGPAALALTEKQVGERGEGGQGRRGAGGGGLKQGRSRDGAGPEAGGVETGGDRGLQGSGCQGASPHPALHGMAALALTEKQAGPPGGKGGVWGGSWASLALGTAIHASRV
jgi:hypothetical protein